MTAALTLSIEMLGKCARGIRGSEPGIVGTYSSAPFEGSQFRVLSVEARPGIVWGIAGVAGAPRPTCARHTDWSQGGNNVMTRLLVDVFDPQTISLRQTVPRRLWPSCTEGDDGDESAEYQVWPERNRFQAVGSVAEAVEQHCQRRGDVGQQQHSDNSGPSSPAGRNPEYGRELDVASTQSAEQQGQHKVEAGERRHRKHRPQQARAIRLRHRKHGEERQQCDPQRQHQRRGKALLNDIGDRQWHGHDGQYPVRDELPSMAESGREGCEQHTGNSQGDQRRPRPSGCAHRQLAPSHRTDRGPERRSQTAVRDDPPDTQPATVVARPSSQLAGEPARRTSQISISPSWVARRIRAPVVIRMSGAQSNRARATLFVPHVRQQNSPITLALGRFIMAAPAQRHIAHSIMAAAASALILVACSTTTPETSTTPGTISANPPAVSPSLASGERAKKQATAAYIGMWRDFVEAAATADWQSQGLAQHATGIALTNLSRALYADHRNGLVTKGEPAHDTQVSSVDPVTSPTRVVIADCSDSTSSLKYRVDNGQLANDAPGGRRQINAIVEKQSDGSWKVSDFGVHEVGSC